MALTRVLINSTLFLLFAIGIELGASRTGNKGLNLIAELIRWGSYVPFAIAASSALHRHKAAILVVATIAILLGEPASLHELSRQLSTIGTGVLVGAATRRIIEPRSNDGPH